jgi:predicted dehydrogenase
VTASPAGVRVAVLGQGSAGRRHREDLAAAGCEVLSYDPQAPDGAGSAEEAIAGADAVVVASPSSLHAEQALLALEHERPVLVEKPLATSAADAERVAAAAGPATSGCGVAMNLRFHPGAVALRDIVRDGRLGDVLYGAASFGYDLRRWRPGTDYRSGYSARADLGGGIVLDAIHELDLVLWLLGPVASVAAETAVTGVLDADVEHLAAAVLRLRSGALVTVDVNFVEASYRRRMLIAGTRGTAIWDWISGTVVLRDGDGGEEHIDATCDVRDTYRAVTADFLASLAGEHAPSTTLAEGLDAVRLADAVKGSAAGGHRVLLA